MTLYMHKETGSTDTAEGWISSYDAEELEARGLTAAEAFAEDVDVTLFPVAESYRQLKERHQAEWNAFPLMFAFSSEQFDRGMSKLGLLPTDTDKIFRLGNTGGYYRKDDALALKEMTGRHSDELHAAIAADSTGEGFIYNMFLYELANHEYIITGNTEDALNALQLTQEDIDTNPALQHGLKLAKVAASKED